MVKQLNKEGTICLASSNTAWRHTLSLLTLRSLALSGLKSMSSISFSCVAKSCTWQSKSGQRQSLWPWGSYGWDWVEDNQFLSVSSSPWQGQENSRPWDDHHPLLLPKVFHAVRFGPPGKKCPLIILKGTVKKSNLAMWFSWMKVCLNFLQWFCLEHQPEMCRVSMDEVGATDLRTGSTLYENPPLIHQSFYC